MPSDQWREFASEVVRSSLERINSRALYFASRSPWQNGYRGGSPGGSPSETMFANIRPSDPFLISLTSVR